MQSAVLLPKLLKGLGAIGGLVCVGFVLMPTDIGAGKNSARRAHCQSNLRQIIQAAQMYAADYDVLPHRRTGGQGWGEVLLSYMKEQDGSVFQCPADATSGQNNPLAAGYSDYWMNANLAGHSVYSFNSPNRVILFGDGDGSSPLSTSDYALATMPSTWRKDDPSPAQRHIGSGNYAFVDGHVKNVSPRGINPDWRINGH